MDKAGDIQAECLILQPVNVTVNAHRNLSAVWYHGHPDFDVEGSMENFTVSFLFIVFCLDDISLTFQPVRVAGGDESGRLLDDHGDHDRQHAGGSRPNEHASASRSYGSSCKDWRSRRPASHNFQCVLQ